VDRIVTAAAANFKDGITVRALTWSLEALPAQRPMRFETTAPTWDTEQVLVLQSHRRIHDSPTAYALAQSPVISDASNFKCSGTGALAKAIRNCS
jgi:hypothetical protein